MAGKSHELVEKNLGLLIVLICVSISFATLVEIVPLFFQKELREPLPNMKPWTALEMEGRDVYIREGCHVCHYPDDSPAARRNRTLWPLLHGAGIGMGPPLPVGFQAYRSGSGPHRWPSIRMTGTACPPDQSRVTSCRSPTCRAFPWLMDNKLDGELTGKKLALFRDHFGVPYTDADIQGAKAAVQGKTEMEALIAYLQQLGTVIKSKR
jgi:cytochrome c oxidase cbb3-type subunit 2